MSNLLYRTIIVTSSVRVEAANEEDLNRMENALIAEVSAAIDSAKIIEGCHPDTSVGDVTTDTEVCDDEEDEEEG